MILSYGFIFVSKQLGRLKYICMLSMLLLIFTLRYKCIVAHSAPMFNLATSGLMWVNVVLQLYYKNVILNIQELHCHSIHVHVLKFKLLSTVVHP